LYVYTRCHEPFQISGIKLQNIKADSGHEICAVASDMKHADPHGTLHIYPLECTSLTEKIMDLSRIKML